MIDFASHFEKALTYQAFLEKYGSAGERSRWAAMHERIQLSDTQKQLLEDIS